MYRKPHSQSPLPRLGTRHSAKKAGGVEPGNKLCGPMQYALLYTSTADYTTLATVCLCRHTSGQHLQLFIRFSVVQDGVPHPTLCP